MSTEPVHDVHPVLVVGGSIVGASAALFLAARGITPVLVEQHVDISTRLRAKVFYPRTMEAYRSVGADADIYDRERGLPPADHAAVVTSLAGAERRRWRLPAADDFGDVSPSPSALVKQADVEAVVRAHAHAAGADLRFGHRLLDLTEHDDHVAARVVGPDGTPYTVRARYVLAADGNRSGVREALGVGRSGPGTVAHSMEIDFTADLRPVLRGRRLAMAFVEGPDHPFLSWTTSHDRGAVTVAYDPDTTDPITDFDPPRCLHTASRALGLPPSAITITGTRRWAMSGWVADTYRVGRTFLVGDAVHVTPPVGGFGANTGIQDAWNLTTKLVPVLRGDAATSLLDRYEAERRPVGRLTVDQALCRLADRVPGSLPNTPRLSEPAVAIGYRYGLGADAGPVAEADEPGRWHGEPGTRVAHAAVTADRSTLDLVRAGRHVVLTGPDGAAWARAADQLQTGHRVVDTAVLPRRAADVVGTGPDGAVLVRPDHVVTWRAAHPASGSAAEVLLRAFGDAGLLPR